MSNFLAELLGTMILIILGDGVVANVVLNKSKGQNSGWIVITAGWGLAVATAVYAVGWISGAHINPAVTIGLAATGQLPWSEVGPYIAGQMIGAILGGVIVYLAYSPHWAETDDANAKLAVFCTAPAVRNIPANLITEIIGTAMLVMGLSAVNQASNALSSGLSPFLCGLVVFSIGLSLGGPTGYAINPARDLGPRISHAILPIPGKRDPDWEYSWVPVVGPIIGAVLGYAIFGALW
jgi:glycerol uptake facilitator protein